MVRQVCKQRHPVVIRHRRSSSPFCNNSTTAQGRTKRLGCPANDDGKRPDGQISKTCPALSAKIFRLTRQANHLYKLAPSHPDEGRIASRHERAVGCDGRDSVGRAMGSQGGSSRERSTGVRTNDAANRFRQNSPDGTRPGKTFGARWSRTAKSCGPGAPMLASSLAEMHSAQPGLKWIVNPQGDGGKKARSPRRARSKP